MSMPTCGASARAGTNVRERRRGLERTSVSRVPFPLAPLNIGEHKRINLGEHKRIAIDSAPLIYFLQNDPDRGPRVRELLDLAASDRVELFTSTVNEAEVLVAPLRSGDRHALAAAREIFASPRILTVVAVTREIALAAATTRARLGLGMPDAILVGTARASECSLVVSNDSDFRKLDDIGYMHLDDLKTS